MELLIQQYGALGVGLIVLFQVINTNIPSAVAGVLAGSMGAVEAIGNVVNYIIGG